MPSARLSQCHPQGVCGGVGVSASCVCARAPARARKGAGHPGCVCVCVCVCMCVCVFSECLFFFDRKTSRTALLSLRSFLSPIFLLCSCFCGSHCVCVCVITGTAPHPVITNDCQ